MRVYVGPGVDFSASVEGRLLEPAELCDLLKGVILISCCIIMNYVDVSMMYHLIRGQAIIKLYIFFNMLEVGNIRRSRGRAGLHGSRGGRIHRFNKIAIQARAQMAADKEAVGLSRIHIHVRI